MVGLTATACAAGWHSCLICACWRFTCWFTCA